MKNTILFILFFTLILVNQSVIATSINITLTEKALVSSIFPDSDLNDDKLGAKCMQTYGIRTFAKYNLSEVNTQFKSAILWLYKTEKNNLVTIDFYHVYNDSWNSQMTWNTQICGAEWNESSSCNLNPFYSYKPSGELGWEKIDITNIISSDDDILSIAFKKHGSDTRCSCDQWTFYKTNSYIEIVLCIPNWEEVETFCQTDDKKLIIYEDTNECGVLEGLPWNNGTYASCDYCIPEWKGFNTTCQKEDKIIEYFFDENNCYSKTNLVSDLLGGSIKSHICDYCGPEWIEVNTSCQSDNTITGYYVDENNCFEQTNLFNDLGDKPNNKTYSCVYCWPKWELNETWSECKIGNTQSRNYYDTNDCNSTLNKPADEYQTCDYTSINIFNSLTNESVTLDAIDETNVSLEISTTKDIIDGEVNITTYSENPGEENFGLIPLNKYIDISADSEIYENLAWSIIKIYYTDEQILELGIIESTLRIHYYNGTDWIVFDETFGGVNTTENFAWANTTHLSLYGLFGSQTQTTTSTTTTTIIGATTSAGGGGGSSGKTVTTTILFFVCEEPLELIEDVIFDGMTKQCDSRDICPCLDYDYCTRVYEDHYSGQYVKEWLCDDSGGILSSSSEKRCLQKGYKCFDNTVTTTTIHPATTTSILAMTTTLEQETETGGTSKPTGKFIIPKKEIFLGGVGLIGLLLILFALKILMNKKNTTSKEFGKQDLHKVVENLKLKPKKPKKKGKKK